MATILLATQPSAATLCEHLAAELRGSAVVRSGAFGGELVTALTRDAASSIELSRKSGAASKDIESLRRQYRPSQQLLEHFNSVADERLSVYSLPDRTFNALVAVGGSAACEAFVFFQTQGDGVSLPFAPLPREGDNDGDNLICNGYGRDGDLAIIDGTKTFLESWSQPTQNQYGFRVVPATDNGWGPACRVDLAFELRFEVFKAFVADRNNPEQKAFASIAARLAQTWAESDDKQTVSLITKPAAKVNKAVARIRTLASRAGDSDKFPTFDDAYVLEQTQEQLSFSNTYPLIVGGRAYLVRIARAGIGCCYQTTDTLLVMYQLNGGALEPIASAIVKEHRGALKSLRVGDSR